MYLKVYDQPTVNSQHNHTHNIITPFPTFPISENTVYIIEEDLPEVGWYLYVYENGKCIGDYLQDTFQILIKQAESDYGIAPDNWEEIS